MIRKQTVKAARLAHYEKAEITGVTFECLGDAFKSVTINTSIGPLTLTLDSYSVSMYEPAMRQVYRATVTDSREVFPPLVKDFDDKHDRNNYVSDFDADGGRFEVAISDFEEASV